MTAFPMHPGLPLRVACMLRHAEVYGPTPTLRMSWAGTRARALPGGHRHEIRGFNIGKGKMAGL